MITANKNPYDDIICPSCNLLVSDWQIRKYTIDDLIQMN